MNKFELFEPETLAEAIELLRGDDPGIRPIGGGTALMLMMKAGMFIPERLVSLRRISGTSGVGLTEDKCFIRIGANTTFSQLEHSVDVRRTLPVLGQTMRSLANIRVRNVATIGGNLAHADPHLDLPPVWVALDARVIAVGPEGERSLAVDDLITGYYETGLSGDEVLTELRVPLKRKWRSNYVKVTTRAAHDWPAIGLAISLEFDGSVVRDCRLCLGSAVDRPSRLFAAEKLLRDCNVGDVDLQAVGEAAVGEVEIVTDEQGSSAYKQHLLAVHLSRAVRSLLEEVSA